MAYGSIVEKLNQELNLQLRRESQVLYILAQIRKVIEHEQRRDETAYEVLELFCNWALHTSISRKSNADRLRLFFQAFDAKEGMSLEDHFRSEFLNRMMQFGVFRRELLVFLEKNGLPVAGVNNHRYWSAFIYLYSSIISEVPLEYTKGDLLPENVESLVVNKLPQTATRQMLTRWVVRLKSGEEFWAATMYGEYRNADGRLIGMPDFFDDHFQL